MLELTSAAPSVDSYLNSHRNSSFPSSLGRDLPVFGGCSFSGYGRPQWGLAVWRRDLLITPEGSLQGKGETTEKLWQEFFLDPSQWWDHRSEKGNARYPDFKHKETQKALWVDGKLTPSWVKERLAALAPGTLQSNIFSWNKRLVRHLKAGQYEKTMKIFEQMQQEKINPDRFTLTPVLNACANLRALEEGRRIHALILQSGFESDLYLTSSLIDMYAKCGSIEDAQSVFNQMTTRSVVSWNAMILGYVKCGQGMKALDLSCQMQQEGVEPDHLTCVGLLNACAKEGMLEAGRNVHSQIMQKGLESNLFVCSSLINMYCKCGSIEDAWRVFDKMPKRDVVTWSAMIQGCVKSGDGKKALKLYKKMQEEQVEPDSITFIALLSACVNIAALDQGRRLHEQIIQQGLESEVFIGSCLVHMYAKCGSIEDALSVFNKMPTRTIVSWNTIIQGLVKCGRGKDALDLSRQMQQEGLDPDCFTFVAILNACAIVGDLDEGKSVHTKILKTGCESDVFVGTSLVDMYAKCGSIEDAWKVFDRMHTDNVVCWNAMLVGFVHCGQGFKALQLFKDMQLKGLEPGSATFVAALNACAGEAALEEGRNLHAQIVQSGFEFDDSVGSSLVDMYAKCGSIVEARKVFDNLPRQSVVLWNVMIVGYVKCGHGHEALILSQQMQEKGVEPDPLTLVGLLNACAALQTLHKGKCVHDQIIELGFESHPFLVSSLIDMYAKCGSIEDAWDVFKKFPTREVVAWSTMIQGYVKCGQGKKALNLFQEMQFEGVKPDAGTFVGILNACACVGDLEEGRRGHAKVIQNGFMSNVFVASSLVDMYGKCGSIEDAQIVFDQLPTRNEVCWNALIHGYVKNGKGQKALQLFQEMQEQGIEPLVHTFVGVLNACASIAALEEGRRVHKQIIQREFESHVFVGSSLIDMYSKCQSIDDAVEVFNKMVTRDVASWNAMIKGYVKCGQGRKALELLERMHLEEVEPDRITFVGILNGCASVMALEEGRFVHDQIIQRGFESDVTVGSSLIDMYGKCGSINDAREVFNKMPTRDVVAWNTMIRGYVKCGHGKKALELFQQMQQDRVKPDSVTFLGLLNACACEGGLEEGRRIHKQIIEEGLGSSEFMGNSLVDMYAKSGSIGDARRVFDEMDTHDVGSWSAMIQGYLKFDEGHEAFKLCKQMQQEGVVEPDAVTFVRFLNACARVAGLEEGKCVHEHIIQRGYESDVFVGTSLVDMYAKCGSIDDASKVFNNMPTRSLASWNAMLGGYALHGLGKEATVHFEQMCQEGVKVDKVTFTSLLAACSHTGLVDEGFKYFMSMRTLHGITPTQEHYTCVVDLLGRSGRLQEAESLIKTVGCGSDFSLCMSLLGACRVHGNVEIGERIAKTIIESYPQNAAGYVMLSNIYATAGMWDKSANIQRQRLELGVMETGHTWIEVNNEVHSFTVDDRQHPQMVEIRSELKRLSAQIKDLGYVPHTRLVLHDVTEKEKVSRLCHHSESLAIAFGLISTPSGTPVHIYKNLFGCGVCHTAAKLISKISMRTITIRDANRFHQFNHGLCSCKDYW